GRSREARLCRSRHRRRHRRRVIALYAGSAGEVVIAERFVMTSIDIDSPPVMSRSAATRNIIAVASGKGGVGKTWFSITLAHALAQAGRRTLLFDGDLGLANVDVQLGVQPHSDIASVIAGETTLAEAVTPFD